MTVKKSRKEQQRAKNNRVKTKIVEYDMFTVQGNSSAHSTRIYQTIFVDDHRCL